MADSDLDIGTLSGSIDLSASPALSALDAFSARVNMAGSAIDNITAQSANAGKEIGDGLKNAADRSTEFGEATSGAMKKVSESTSEASKNADEAHKSFMEMFEDPIGAIKEFAQSIESDVLGALGVLGVGLAAATGAAIGLSLSITELGQEGSKIIGVENSFDRFTEAIGQSAEAMKGALSDALGHTVSDMQIMSDVNKALGAGVNLTEADMTTLGLTAKALGRATGTDAATGLDTLTQALTRGNTRALAQLGISVDLVSAESKFAAQLGVTRDALSAAGVMEAKRQAILQASRDYVDKAGTAEALWTSKIKQGQIAIEEWVASLSVAVARSPAITAAVNTIGVAISSAFGNGKGAIDAIMSGLNAFAGFVQASVPYVTAAFGAVKDFWNWLVQLNDQFHITDTIISVVVSAWNGLKTAFDFVRDAAQKVIDTWATMPAWLQTVTIRSVEATSAMYAIGKGIEATKGPIEGLVDSGLSLVGVLANIAQITGGTFTSALAKAGTLFGATAVELDAVAVGMSAAGVAAVGAEAGTVGFGATLLALVTGPVALTIAAVGAIGVAVYEAAQHWDGLKTAATTTWDAIVSVSTTAWNALAVVFNAVIDTGVFRLIAALTELELKIAGWGIVLAGTVAWKSIALSFEGVSIVVQALIGWYEILWSGLIKIATWVMPATIVEGVTGLSIAFSALSTVIGKVVDGLKWLNDHTPSPTALLPPSLPTPARIGGDTNGPIESNLPASIVLPTADINDATEALKKQNDALNDNSKYLKDNADAIAAAVKALEGDSKATDIQLAALQQVTAARLDDIDVQSRVIAAVDKLVAAHKLVPQSLLDERDKLVALRDEETDYRVSILQSVDGIDVYIGAAKRRGDSEDEIASSLQRVYGITDITAGVLKKYTAAQLEAVSVEDQLVSIREKGTQALESATQQGLQAQLDAIEASTTKQIEAEQRKYTAGILSLQQFNALRSALISTRDDLDLAKITAFDDKELQAEQAIQEKIIAAQDAGIATGIAHTVAGLEDRRAKEQAQLVNTEQDWTNHWQKVMGIDQLYDALEQNARVTAAKQTSDKLLALETQLQEADLSLMQDGLSKDLALNDLKRIGAENLLQVELAQNEALLASNKVTSDTELAALNQQIASTKSVLNATESLYAANARKIVLDNDPIFKAWQSLNLDMKNTWADTWTQGLTSFSAFGQAFETTLTQSLRDPFFKVLGAMLADFENVLLSPLLNALRQLENQFVSYLVSTGLSEAGVSGGGAAGGGSNILGTGINAAESYGAKSAFSAIAAHYAGTAATTWAGTIPMAASYSGGIGLGEAGAGVGLGSTIGGTGVAGGVGLGETGATTGLAAASNTTAAAGGGLGASAGIAAGYGGIAIASWELGQWLGSKTNNQPLGAAIGAGSGAATGAAIGSIVPGLGTGIGALVGGIAGAISGWKAAGKAYDEVKQDQADFIKNFGDISGEITAVGQAYALTGKSGDQAQAALHSMWDAKTPADFAKAVAPVATALKTLQQNTADLQAASLDATGRITDAWKRVIALNTQYGSNTTEVLGFISQQATTVVSGFNSVVAAQQDAVAGYDDIKKAVDDAQSSVNDLSGQTALDALKATGTATAAQIAKAQAAVDKLMSTSAAGVAASKSGQSIDALLKNGPAAVIAAQQAVVDALAKSGATGSPLDQAESALMKAQATQKAAATAAAPELSDLGAQAVGTYTTQVASGTSPIDATKAETDALTTLEQEYKDLGLTVTDVGLKSLFTQNDMMKASGTLLAGVQGLTQEMVGLDNINLETTDSFANQQRTAEEMYTRLQAAADATAKANGDMSDQTAAALLPMQAYLHQAVIEAENLNVPLDALTQQMIDQSKATGVWKDALTPPASVQDAIQKLADTVNDLSRAIRGLPPIPAAPAPTPAPTTNPDTSAPTDAVDDAMGGMVPKPQYLATGGPVGTDTQPAWLTPGELVIPKSLTAELSSLLTSSKTSATDDTVTAANQATEALAAMGQAGTMAFTNISAAATQATIPVASALPDDSNPWVASFQPPPPSLIDFPLPPSLMRMNQSTKDTNDTLAKTGSIGADSFSTVDSAILGAQARVAALTLATTLTTDGFSHTSDAAQMVGNNVEIASGKMAGFGTTTQAEFGKLPNDAITVFSNNLGDAADQLGGVKEGASNVASATGIAAIAATIFGGNYNTALDSVSNKTTTSSSLFGGLLGAVNATTSGASGLATGFDAALTSVSGKTVDTGSSFIDLANMIAGQSVVAQQSISGINLTSVDNSLSINNKSWADWATSALAYIASVQTAINNITLPTVPTVITPTPTGTPKITNPTSGISGPVLTPAPSPPPNGPIYGPQGPPTGGPGSPVGTGGGGITFAVQQSVAPSVREPAATTSDALPSVTINVDATGAYLDGLSVDELATKIQDPFWQAVYRNRNGSYSKARASLNIQK